MNNSRFIELLNLYVDQELSAEEAVELEREIAQNPQRRATYNQYCRMQRASVALFDAVNRQAPVPQMGRLWEAVQRADAKIEHFPTPLAAPVVRRRWRGWQPLVLAGGMAASLLVVATVAWRGAESGVGVAPTPAVASGVPEAPLGGVAVVQSEAVRLPVVERRSVAERNGSSAGTLFLATWLRSAGEDETRAAEYATAETANLDWMNQVEFRSMPQVAPEQLRFEVRPTLLDTTDPRTFRGRGGSAATVEMSAFQFQR